MVNASVPQQRVGLPQPAHHGRNSGPYTLPATPVADEPVADEPSVLSPTADGNVTDNSTDNESRNDADADADGGAGALDEGLYSPCALFKRQCLPRQAWELDEATSACRQCRQPFTLFVRRHHCRRCGLVVCDSCSSRRVLLAAPGLPASSEDPGSDADADDTTPLAYLHWSRAASTTYWRFREYRTCDPCAEAVDSLQHAHADSLALVDAELGSSDARSNAYNAFEATYPGTSAQPGGATAARTLRRRLSSSSIHVCPVCSLDWVAVWTSMARMPGEGWLEVQERHTRECLENEFRGQSRTPSNYSAADSAQSRPVPGSQAVGTASQPRPASLGIMNFLARSLSTSHDSAATAGTAGRAGTSGSHHHHSSNSPAGRLARHTRPPRPARYTTDVVKSGMLPIGEECAICLEEYAAGDIIARLTCLCTYHLHCLQEWLGNTDTCPVHGG